MGIHQRGSKQKMVKYSKDVDVEDRAAKARGSDLRVSFKNTRETAMSIRGLPLRRAQKFLQDVIDRKQAVVFHRYCHKVGRKAMAKQAQGGKTQARWPEKSCRFLLDLLTNVESNAEMKNLDVEKLIIDHIQVNRAMHQRRRTYRAHGRINPFMSNPCHIELICVEDEDAVMRPEDAEGGKRIKKISKKKQARERMRSGMTAGGD